MKRLGRFLLDIIYPVHARCLGCGDESGCDEPFLCNDCLNLLNPSYIKTTHEEWDKRGLRSVRFVYYYGRPVRGLIRALKFSSVKMLSEQMAQDMSDLLEIRPLDHIDIIVPVPLHPSRLYSRGFNQSELLANALSAKCGIPVDKAALRRMRKTKQQSKLSHNERNENVQNAFRATKALNGLRVLVLDDVITTGNTVAACAEALHAAGASEVHAIAYAGTHFYHKLKKRKIYRLTEHFSNHAQ